MRGRVGEGGGGGTKGAMGGTRGRIREGWEEDGKKAWRKREERWEESERTWGKKAESRGERRDGRKDGRVDEWTNERMDTKVGEHSLSHHRTSAHPDWSCGSQ